MRRKLFGYRDPLDVASTARPARVRVGAVLQGKKASWSDILPVAGVIAGGVAGYYSNGAAPIAAAIVGSFSGLLAGAFVEERVERAAKSEST